VVGPDAGDQEAEAGAPLAQEDAGVEQVERAFPPVDPAVVEDRRRVADRTRPPTRPRPEAPGVHGPGNEGEPLQRRAQSLPHLLGEGAATDQDRVGVAEHALHGQPVGGAAGADPMPVAALD
jgi:hypothetical protein